MTIGEILNFLPRNEVELIDATRWQEMHLPERRRLFEAREQIEKLWRQNPTEQLYEAMQLLPHDALHFEALVASGEGQDVARANIKKAIEILTGEKNK